MRTVNRSALVPYRAAQMYALVDDIAAYPQFLPWCQGAKELSRSADKVVASLKVGFEAINTQFTTENRLCEPTGITMQLQDGPFSVLEGEWSFEQLGDSGCNVTLKMRFEFSNTVQDMLLGASFERICDQLIDAFIERARATLS